MTILYREAKCAYARLGVDTDPFVCPQGAGLPALLARR